MLLLVHAIATFRNAPGYAAWLLPITSASLGLLVLIGLWTPVVGVLAALDTFFSGCTATGGAQFWLLLTVVGLAIALLGHGAWSVDAKLFGWRRIEIDLRDP
jgi:putative oxidoreductase